MNSYYFITFALGILFGEVGDFIFDRLNERNIEGEISLLHWLEHYHWGMVFLLLYDFTATYFPQLPDQVIQITSSTFLVGFGISLILDENRSDTKFAWKKNAQTQFYHFYESSVIGIMIGAILVLKSLYLPLSFLTIAFVLDLIVGTMFLIRKPFKTKIAKAGALKD